MTDRDHDDGFVRRALRELPTPDHRPGFWDDLRVRLVSEPRAGADASGPHGVVALHEPPGRAPSNRRVLVAAAAIVVALAAVAVGVLSARDEREVGVTVRPDPVPTRTSAAAARTALEWLDLLAAGDMTAAWERLGPTAREVWPSFDAFSRSRSAFSEGMALWASAEQRSVGTAAVTRGGTTFHVVTITGVRRPEGDEEDGALVIVVRDDRGGRVAVEPFSPVSAGVAFTVPAPGPRPPSIGAQTPVALRAPDDGELLVVLDRDEAVVRLDREASGAATFLPAGGWSSGRHVVTALFLTPAGDPVTAAAVFDVAS